jgi:heme/copper-type cytochrome/quinol oxidase subunit 4
MTKHESQSTAEGSPANDDELDSSGSLIGYTAGLAFALLLTGASFLVAGSHLFWTPGIPVGLAVLAIAQMGVHLACSSSPWWSAGRCGSCPT